MGNFKCMDWVYFISVSWPSEARKVTVGAWCAAIGDLQNPFCGVHPSGIPGTGKGCALPVPVLPSRGQPRNCGLRKTPRISASVWDVLSLKARHMERCGKLELKVLLKVTATVSETTFFFPLEFPRNHLPPTMSYVVKSSFALAAAYFSNILILHGCLVFNLCFNGLKLPI